MRKDENNPGTITACKQVKGRVYGSNMRSTGINLLERAKKNSPSNENAVRGIDTMPVSRETSEYLRRNFPSAFAEALERGIVAVV